MPSGKTHDAFTFLLTLPVGLISLVFSGDLYVAIPITFAFLFGGLMFGPDLDTHSNQYTRWGMFRFLWYPYQVFFSHRSRWSHGYLFGTLLRVIYFSGILTLLSFIFIFFLTGYIGGEVPWVFDYTESWSRLGTYLRLNFGEYILYFVFLGLWLGAASHTSVDMIGTFIKTGRIGKIF